MDSKCPIRKNLVLTSICIIVFYSAGGTFIADSSDGLAIRLQVINVAFENRLVLACFAWGMLVFFAFQFWQEYRFKFKNFMKCYLSRCVSNPTGDIQNPDYFTETPFSRKGFLERTLCRSIVNNKKFQEEKKEWVRATNGIKYDEIEFEIKDFTGKVKEDSNLGETTIYSKLNWKNKSNRNFEVTLNELKLNQFILYIATFFELLIKNKSFNDYWYPYSLFMLAIFMGAFRNFEWEYVVFIPSVCFLFGLFWLLPGDND